MVSSTVGSPTSTCWKRRSSAGSFSMFWRNSSSVVAPTIRSSPRASIGLSMLPASIEPSASPAPTTVCISSMNVMIWPSESLISSRTALSRSSNSPRYFAPATIAPRSSATIRLSRRVSGTSPSTMRWARPSTTAVLPTPGSPMRTGLFLVRRDSTCTTRRISVSRPMTGSSSPPRARSVRSTPYFSSALYVPSGSWLVTRRTPPRTLANASTSALGSACCPRSRVGHVAARVGQADQQVLGGDEVVADLLGLALRDRERGHQRAAELRGGDVGALRPRQAAQQRLAAGPHGAGVGADGGQQRAGDALGLVEQGEQQVHGGDLGVALRDGALDGGGDRLLALGGQSVVRERVATGPPHGGSSFLLPATPTTLSVFRSTLSARTSSGSGQDRGSGRQTTSALSRSGTRSRRRLATALSCAEASAARAWASSALSSALRSRSASTWFSSSMIRLMPGEVDALLLARAAAPRAAGRRRAGSSAGRRRPTGPA